MIEFYDRGGENNPFLDGGMRPLALTDQEKADLVALMETFTSSDLARFAELEKLAPEARAEVGREGQRMYRNDMTRKEIERALRRALRRRPSG